MDDIEFNQLLNNKVLRENKTVNQAIAECHAEKQKQESEQVIANLRANQREQKPTINPHSYDFYFKMLYELHYPFFFKSKTPYSEALPFIDKHVREILALKDQ